MNKLDNDLELLRSDPQFKQLLHNLYSQARTCAKSPFEKERGRKDFEEIAELDVLSYLKQSNQIKWIGEHHE